jgi:hypothetical protein
MIKITILATTMMLCTMVIAEASGTYIPPTGRVPKKGSSKSGGEMDGALYALGQKTFEGKMMKAGAGDASRQKSQLMALQAKVPANSNTNLLSLAGKITDEQVRALEYYVGKRFGM